jgi:murein DD-endopeptidase MepM/ murein hydrolase activator NlpD
MVTYLDGKRVSVEELSRDRLSEPVSARVRKGTRSLYSPDSGISVSVGASGFVWPAPRCHSISSTYGYRWGWHFHKGVDMISYGGGTSGSAVVASLDGTVESTTYSGDYGYRIIINHGGGIKTTYSHLLSGSTRVYPGQRVLAGTQIGRVGSTGWSYGSHLHFEILVNGVYRNPMPYLR